MMPMLAPVSGKARIEVRTFLFPGLGIQTLKFTRGVGQPEPPATWQLTEFFPFFPVVLIAEQASNVNLVF